MSKRCLNEMTCEPENCNVQRPSKTAVKKQKKEFGFAPTLLAGKPTTEPPGPWYFHSYAAKASARKCFPSSMGRMLGTISRTVTATKPMKRERVKIDSTCMTKHHHLAKITKALARKEASSVECTKDDARIAEIVSFWHSRAVPEQPCWSNVDGRLLGSTHPIKALIDWDFEDPFSEKKQTFYDGLKTVKIDMDSILGALEELSTPIGMYEVPLIMPLIRVESIGKQQYNISIGVYANRLLPEVMTESALHILMSALDENSYRITEPLHLPPPIDQPVFLSAPSPKVVTPQNSDDLSIYTRMEDLTMEGSTRQQDTICVFTVPGLMKLIESKGNDVSQWPTIERKIGDRLKLSLMLHQIHAVCWMIQMESLKGFGVNSLLWEEREFLDGGRYYYSPALGQLRFSKPITMLGGLLCDEQGLGKTMEVLGLILATLEELKEEAKEFPMKEGLSAMHATLIIVPPALVSQWIDEIHKATGDTLVIQRFDPQDKEYYPASMDTNAFPDIVVTTYQALETKTIRYLACYSWGRVVLDEMQEIRSSTTMIAKNCDSLKSKRRWMLSGTPLYEGVEDLKGELNFLGLEPFAAKNEDGYFNYAIKSHWDLHSLHAVDTLRILGLLTLRRSKSMTIAATGAPLMGLEPLTVDFVPVPQRPSERALYCFLEFVISRELKTLGESRKDGTSRSRCLRMLREMCISPVLMNGGMGVNSDLPVLNAMLVKENRRIIHPQLHAPTPSCSTATVSCAEAIRYISQVQQTARTDDDFVTDLQVGMGGGAAYRARATDSIDDQQKELNEKLKAATMKLVQAVSNRSRARWHWALEKVTTSYCSYDSRVAIKIRDLWNWRFACTGRQNASDARESQSIPSFLDRGWRPTISFYKTLVKNHPSYHWAQSRSLFLNNIPQNVSSESILLSIKTACGEVGVQLHPMESKTHSEHWRAFLVVSNDNDYKQVLNKAKSTKGIKIEADVTLSEFRDAEASAISRISELEDAQGVYPTLDVARKLKAVRAELDTVKNGLRMLAPNPNREYVLPSVCLLTNNLCLRDKQPGTRMTFLSLIEEKILDCTSKIEVNKSEKASAKKKLEKLERALAVPDHVKRMSVYEMLQAVESKDFDETYCAICMDHFGEDLLAVTGCGHIYCHECLSSYIESRAGNTTPPCPECRKPLNTSQNLVIKVDPKIETETMVAAQKRSQAKSVIHRAAEMLAKSAGQLDPDIWEQIYLSIDLPAFASTRGDPLLTATPKHVIQHFHAATSMPSRASARHYPASGLGLSSKIARLMHDLPKDERSVVFTSSSKSINHLLACLTVQKLSFQAIFTGQKIEEQQEALKAWKTGTTFPILVVQAGAAASGLTLTDASKMFLLEPFVRQEQEEQAYARCHRYGQTKPVYVKVYYTPVSVESRLLEWRKLSVTQQSADSKVVYSTMLGGGFDEDGSVAEVTDDSNSDENDDIDFSADNEDQTMFLLGLVDGEE